MLLFNFGRRVWLPIVVAVPVGAVIVDVVIVGDSFRDAVELAVPILLIGVVQAAFYQQIRAKVELTRARTDLARLAVSEERLRIARDLHDILGQRLSAVSLKAELAARLVERDPTRAATEMGEVAAVARAALSDVRETVSGYRALTLATEIETARALLIAAGVSVEVACGGDPLPEPLDECAGAVVREAVTNVIRHAGSGRCAIQIGRESGAVVVEVRDTGTGTARTDRRQRRVRQRPDRAGGTRRAGRRDAVDRPRARSVRRPRDDAVRRGRVIRILLADDQHLVRGALAALLALEDDFEVVASVADGSAAVRAAVEHKPDVALLDVEMPGLDGVSATREIRSQAPGVRVMILTTFGRPGYLRRAMDAGARGFMVKDAPPDRLADAVRQVHGGRTVVDPALAVASLSSGANPLTDREADALRAAEDGGTVADIARVLILSEGTVRNYLSAAIGKTGARTRAEAARVARDNGWL